IHQIHYLYHVKNASNDAGSFTWNIFWLRSIFLTRPDRTFPDPTSIKGSTPAAIILRMDDSNRTREYNCMINNSLTLYYLIFSSAVTFAYNGIAASFISTLSKCF